MCPMCSEPVTFGGGITIENTGPGASASALNSSSLTQYSAQRGSICCGSYALEISRAIRRSTPTTISRRTHTRLLFPARSNLRLYGGKTSSVNSTPRTAGAHFFPFPFAFVLTNAYLSRIVVPVYHCGLSPGASDLAGVFAFWRRPVLLKHLFAPLQNNRQAAQSWCK